MEDIRFTFFKINKCGYYPWKSANASFGGMEDTLEQLQTWSAGKDLSQTKIVNPCVDDDILATYLFDIKKYKKFWVIACWNETPSSANSVASISPNSKVGAPKIHDNPLVKGTIAGYPTYFLFFPHDALMATMRIGNSPTGRMAMEKYIGSFLETQTKYVSAREDDEGEVIFSYSDKPDGKSMKVWPRFSLSPVKKPGHEEYLRKNIGSIRKVIKTAHLNTSITRDREMFQRLRRFVLGMPSKITTSSERRIYLEIDYEPTQEEFEAIVEEESLIASRKWDDVGFSLTGDSEIYWLGRSRASANVGIVVNRDENNVINMDDFVINISKRMSEIMAIADV